MRNLLSNAAKYGGAGTTVAIDVDADEDEVYVRDHRRRARLPADEEAERVFDLFFRSQGTACAPRARDRPVRLRPPHPGDGRPDLGDADRDGGGAEFGFTLRVMTDEA